MKKQIREVFLIDGVAQPLSIWKRRQIWGECASAKFDRVEEVTWVEEKKPRN